MAICNISRTVSSFSKSGMSLLEILLIVAIICLAFITIYPSVTRVKDAVAIETASRNLQKIETHLNTASKIAEDIASTEDKTALEAVTKLMELKNEKLLDWPNEADLSSLNIASTNGPTIQLNLRNGEKYTVTTEDVTSPR